MIRDILQFFKTEKIYTALTLVLAVFLLAVWFFQPKGKEESAEKNRQAYEVLRQAEERMQERIEQAGSMEAYLKERPGLSNAFRFLMVSSSLVFLVGLIFNFRLAFNPGWRERLALPYVRGPAAWNFSMLYKVILLFIAGALSLNLTAAFLHSVFFPGVSENLLLILQVSIADLFCLALIFWQVRCRGGNVLDLGLTHRGQSWFTQIKYALGAYTALIPSFLVTLVLAMVVTQWLGYEPPPHPLVHVFVEEEARSPWLVTYSIFLAVLVGPVTEEIFFRGFCYPIFKSRFGLKWALVLSSLFFALVHESSFAFLPIFVLGFGLASIYELRGSLWIPMLIHSLHNSVFIGYFFLVKQIIQVAGA